MVGRRTISSQSDRSAQRTPAAQFYPNATYTPFAPQQEQALAMMEQRAMQGSPLNQLAQNAVAKAALGGMGINMPQGSVPNVSASGITDPVRSSLGQTLSGRFVNSNPFLSDTLGIRMLQPKLSQENGVFNEQP